MSTKCLWNGFLTNVTSLTCVVATWMLNKEWSRWKGNFSGQTIRSCSNNVFIYDGKNFF